jgi:NitT/TauT family transport system ATP-binding protein
MDIRLQHVSKQFGENRVIKDLNVTFANKQMNCLMGASGIGKTTIINIIMGLAKPDEGTIQGLRGKRIAAVFQEERLIEHWDAIQNVRLACDKSVTAEDVMIEFDKVGLTGHSNKPVRELSGGMRRRVAIVRATMAKSDLIIMDEPFKGLDEALKIHIIEYVKEKTKGKTTIIVTHEKDEVELLEAKLVTLG